MIQGPLALVPRLARIPLRIENAAVTAKDPATPSRIRNWVAQNIHVEGRPDWVFVKVHTHGAPETQAAALLGEPGRALHRELTTHYNDGVHWKLHYVTAREMYNVAQAAVDGRSGDPHTFRDFRLPPPPAQGR
jgi:phage gpG-like protein